MQKQKGKRPSQCRSHLIKGLKESMPRIEEELTDPNYSYKVQVFYGYHKMANMIKVKKQGRLVVVEG